ncbi:MAG: hypothetical protein MUD12_12105 [Spirochaetes bacterium]|nr:hypothetical protein [Spirochaetota bacterium]
MKKLLLSAFYMLSVTGMLIAQTEGRPDNSYTTDNPAAAVAVVFLLMMVVSIGLINFFGLQRRGRIIIAVILGFVNIMIVAPILAASGMSGSVNLLISLASSIVYCVIIIRFGKKIARWIGRHEVRDDDRDW